MQGRSAIFVLGAVGLVLAGCASTRDIGGADPERDGARQDGGADPARGDDAPGDGGDNAGEGGDDPDGSGARDDGSDPRDRDPGADPDGSDPAADGGGGSDGDGVAPSDPDPGPWATMAGSDPAHPIFDQATLRSYRLEVDPDEWAYINETAYLEEYIEGMLTVDGETYGPVGVRFKGFRGSLYNCFDFDDSGQAIARTCDRLSLKVSFNEYDPEGRFFGLKKLNFHSMNNDSSKLRERTGYFLFRRFGVHAPRAVHATLSVNGEDLGLYALVEQVDGRFTRMRFDDGGEGNVYKERWPTSSTDPEYFLSGLKTNEDDPDVDVSAMVAFAEALQNADASNIEEILRAHTDLDQLLRYFVVDRAIDHWDGPTAFRCQPEEDVDPLPPEVLLAQTPPLGWEVCQNKNFYWYERTDDGRVSLIAWDTDVTFSSFPSPFPPWDEPADECVVEQWGRPPMCDPLIALLATTLRPRFDELGRQFLAEVFEPSALVPHVQAWSQQIQPYLGSADLFARDANLFIDRLGQYHGAFSASVDE